MDEAGKPKRDRGTMIFVVVLAATALFAMGGFASFVWLLGHGGR